ncbi:MAG: tetratricopeptide repeat protein [Elusimicrobia bacterium]|nr:tetratricopeptide repeat protein [Elusimicrobiota bacterium]
MGAGRTPKVRVRTWGVVLAAAALSACVGLPRVVRYRDPLGAEEHVRLGQTYEEEGRREESADQFRAALKRDASNIGALVGLGNAALDRGDLKDAQAYFERVLAAKPRQAAACNNLALVYLARNERLGEAEVLARTALEQEGSLQPYVLDTLANILLRQKRLAEAGLAIERAVAKAPEVGAVRKRLMETRRAIDEAVLSESRARGAP